MITINDDDLPITVVSKLVQATRTEKVPPIRKALIQATTGEHVEDEIEVDMFDIDDLQEIAKYLMVFCSANREEEKDDLQS